VHSVRRVPSYSNIKRWCSQLVWSWGPTTWLSISPKLSPSIVVRWGYVKTVFILKTQETVRSEDQGCCCKSSLDKNYKSLATRYRLCCEQQGGRITDRWCFIFEGTHLADSCVLTKLEQCQLFLQSPLHACPLHGSWATFMWLNIARAKSEILTLQNWDKSAKEDNPDRKHLPSRTAGGLAWGWQPHPGKDSCHESWRIDSRIIFAGRSFWGRTGPAQGCRANESDMRFQGLTLAITMIMMMMMMLLLFYINTRVSCTLLKVSLKYSQYFQHYKL
jgi:hypothetical protein